MDGVRKGVAWKEQEKSGQLHGKSNNRKQECEELVRGYRNVL